MCKYIYLENPFKERITEKKTKRHLHYNCRATGKNGEQIFYNGANLIYHNYCRNFDGNYEKGISFIEDEILDYHSNYRFFKFLPKHKFSIGIEMETEGNREYETVGELNKRCLWIKERDGSLDDENGFELISPAYSLNIPFITKEIELLGDNYFEEAYHRSSNSCGNHFHIGLNENTKNGSDKEIFEMICGYVPLLCALYPNRRNNHYCNASSKRRILDSYRGCVALNNFTCELRIFPAIISKKQLLWRIQLIELFLQNPSNDYREIVSMCVNPKTDLYFHLSKVYGLVRYAELIKRLTKETELLEGVYIQAEKIPMTTIEKKKIERIKNENLPDISIQVD